MPGTPLIPLAAAAPAAAHYALPQAGLHSLRAPPLFSSVVPNGVATGLDIGLSNYSLVFITLSFYVMCKSTTPLFLLAFAIAWRVEQPSWQLAGVVAVITAGLLLLVAGEVRRRRRGGRRGYSAPARACLRAAPPPPFSPRSLAPSPLPSGQTKFNLVGFLLVMTAAALSGLRWTITQVRPPPARAVPARACSAARARALPPASPPTPTPTPPTHPPTRRCCSKASPAAPTCTAARWRCFAR